MRLHETIQSLEQQNAVLRRSLFNIRRQMDDWKLFFALALVANVVLMLSLAYVLIR